MTPTSEKLLAPETFDRLVDRLGPSMATEILQNVTAYVADHDDCRLGGVDVELQWDEDGPRRVEVKFHHQPGCSAAAQPEGNRP